MKKIFLVILMNWLAFSGFAKELGIKILTNPVLPLYDIGYAFADDKAETFQILGDLEVQIPFISDFEFSIYQKLSFDRYFESYCVTSDGVIDSKKALQTEYFIEPGITYNFRALEKTGKYQAAPFITLSPIIGFVDVHSEQNRADFLMLGAGLIGGYQWNSPSGFTLKLYAGLSKTGEINLSKSSYIKVDKSSLFGLPFDLRLGCRIGLRL